MQPSEHTDIASHDNTLLVSSVQSVETLLARFYGRYPWPWPSLKFDTLDDPDFETRMTNQDVGDWTHGRLPEGARIWVAGCGVNQGIITALRYPKAEVIGSDISVGSLDLCRQMVSQIGVPNLELREESINAVEYDGEFDFVISTGVIHHNADPGRTLARLAAALKPDGFLELMVYNQFHRTVTSSFQKAIRILTKMGTRTGDFERGVDLARKLIADLPVKETLERAFTQYMEWSESDLADLLVQPVEHSYTIESLNELFQSCGLEYVLPCISRYARNLSTNLFWNLDLQDPDVAAIYYDLPDERRWQITNLILHDRSPLLWFYAQRQDSRFHGLSQQSVADAFLAQRFVPAETEQRSYVRDPDDVFEPNFEPVPYPSERPGETERHIMARVQGGSTVGEALDHLGIPRDLQIVDRIRTHLATGAFPYLVAVP